MWNEWDSTYHIRYNKLKKFRQYAEGETLEMKIDRFINNREPITDNGSSAIYMERKEGVNAAYNIKTDRFEVALEAMNKVSRSIDARRDEKAKMEIVKGNEERGNFAEQNDQMWMTRSEERRVGKEC